jgi:hypothetical protein
LKNCKKENEESERKRLGKNISELQGMRSPSLLDDHLGQRRKVFHFFTFHSTFEDPNQRNSKLHNYVKIASKSANRYLIPFGSSYHTRNTNPLPCGADQPQTTGTAPGFRPGRHQAAVSNLSHDAH